MIRKPYDTDLTDQEWAMIEPYFQTIVLINDLNENSLMRPYTSLRQDVNGVCFHMIFLLTQLYGVSFVVLRKVGYGIPF